MEKKLALLLGVLFLLPLAHFFGADLQVKASETQNSDLGISDDSEDGVSKRNRDQAGLVDDEGKSGEKSDPRKGSKARKLDAGSDDQKKKTTKPKKVESDGEIKMVSEKKEGSIDRTGDSKKGLDDNDSESRSGESRDSEGTVKRSENSEIKVEKDRGNGGLKREDDCYSSYKCSDKDNVLIACLRVPGNDSPHLSLSLLIQNKGNESLTIDISAPDSVQLESTKVQLQKEENKQVEVSIGSSGGGGKQSSIVLTSGPRVCDLDFKDLMTSHGYKYLRLTARRPAAIAAFLSLSALAIVGSAWMCFVSRRRRKRLSKLPIGNTAYQKLDNTGLPVDAPNKSSENDGWDESWGDDWDDEEAQPLTPSKPSHPSFSSNTRLASRLSKENRED